MESSIAPSRPSVLSIEDASSLWDSLHDCFNSCQSSPVLPSNDLNKSLQILSVNIKESLRAMEEKQQAAQNYLEHLEWINVDLEASNTLLTLSHARLQRLYSQSLRDNADLSRKFQETT